MHSLKAKPVENQLFKQRGSYNCLDWRHQNKCENTTADHFGMYSLQFCQTHLCVTAPQNALKLYSHKTGMVLVQPREGKVSAQLNSSLLHSYE